MADSSVIVRGSDILGAPQVKNSKRPSSASPPLIDKNGGKAAAEPPQAGACSSEIAQQKKRRAVTKYDRRGAAMNSYMDYVACMNTTLAAENKKSGTAMLEVQSRIASEDRKARYELEVMRHKNEMERLERVKEYEERKKAERRMYEEKKEQEKREYEDKREQERHIFEQKLEQERADREDRRERERERENKQFQAKLFAELFGRK